MSVPKKIDYHAYDRLAVTIKTEKEDEMLKRYRSFGWEEIDRSEDDRYDDIEHITFIRPHAVAHKDELQYLQVNMETEANNNFLFEKRKTAKTISLGTVAIMLGFIVFCCGIFLSVNSANYLALGIVLSLVGFIGTIALAPLMYGMRKKQKHIFEERAEQSKKMIETICAEAVRLREESDEVRQ